MSSTIATLPMLQTYVGVSKEESNDALLSNDGDEEDDEEPNISAP